MARAVGVDVGAEALRGVVLEDLKGQLQVVSAGAVPLGEVAALEDTPDKRLAIAEKLKELVRSARLKAPARRVTASGKPFALRYLTVPPVPPWRLEMLAKYEIDEHTDEREPQAFDYHILDVPDMSGQYTVLLGSCDERHAGWLLETSSRAGLGEVEIDLKAVALYNAYYHGHGYEPDKTVLVVDIGATEVTALVIRNGALYLARDFEGGARRFTQVLADELKTNALEAEEVKKNEGEILFDVPLAGNTATVRARRTQRLGATSLTRRGTEGESEGAAPASALPGAKAEAAPPETVPERKAEVPGPASDVVFLEDADAPPASEAPPPEENSGTDRTSGLSPNSPPAASVNEAKDAPALDMRPVGVPLSSEATAERRRRQVSQALLREAAGLGAALENCVNQARQQYKLRELKVDAVYLAGAGSRLKGLPMLLSRRLRAPVEPLQSFRRIGMERLPPEAAETLRAEQDTMAVAAGLALSPLRAGAFSLLLWPDALKERKAFWARDAYLFYAAGLFLAALALFLYTPYRNAEVLTGNQGTVTKAVEGAEDQQAELDGIAMQHEELLRRLEQIDTNVRSGEFFLNVLAHLKDTKRIPPHVYLTSLSTGLPPVVLPESEKPAETPGLREPGVAPARAPAATAPGATTDTFQAQAKVYLRGFVRSGQKSELYNLIKGDRTKTPFVPGFCDLLVPHPENPDHPDNVFKDIRPVWVDPSDHPSGPRFLKEFVLEAFVEGTHALTKPKAQLLAERAAEKRAGPPAAKVPAPEPAKQVVPAPEPAKQAAPEPAKQVVPAPEPAKQAAPAPEPAKQAAPAPEPAKQAVPAPEPVKQAAPAPGPAKENVPAAEPVKQAAPAPEKKAVP
jgi:Tfp pilus assembly PilM family ATPase